MTSTAAPRQIPVSMRHKNHTHSNRHHACSNSDAALLDMLTGSMNPTLTGDKSARSDLLASMKVQAAAATNTKSSAHMRRDSELDPILLAAAAASGPNITRNHYQHDFFPGVMLPRAEGSWDWTRFVGEKSSEEREQQEHKRLVYASRQAPRSTRLRQRKAELEDYGTAIVDPAPTVVVPAVVVPAVPTAHLAKLPPVTVQCMARTRIPTPHGPAFLHLYYNSRDSKEHLAIVVDNAQLTNQFSAPPIRSQSLDAKWSEDETDMDRITRGAYIGKLSAGSQVPSTPTAPSASRIPDQSLVVPAPLVRIHSECFTGETIGSMRCDCGEQLDEALRLISQPVHVASDSQTVGTVSTTLTPSTISSPTDTPFQRPGTSPRENEQADAHVIPARGAVIYLRQEGRGIGLLSKIRAYNLQDLGHDTVTANLMLGHGADERGYEIAAAILRDLSLGGEGTGESIRLLTNNPDKVQALQNEGVRIAERVPMIPRSWVGRTGQDLSFNNNITKLQSTVPPSTASHKHTDHHHHHTNPIASKPSPTYPEKQIHSIPGATLIGGGAVYGDDLDRYLRTKVLRMGHMLPIWLEEQGVGYESQ